MVLAGQSYLSAVVTRGSSTHKTWNWCEFLTHWTHFAAYKLHWLSLDIAWKSCGLSSKYLKWQQGITMVVKQRRWRWLGHIIRKGRDSITRTALRWTPDSGRRKRGHPRETWRRTILAEMKPQGRRGKNLRRQPWKGSNGNLWSQPYVPLRREEDYVLRS